MLTALQRRKPIRLSRVLFLAYWILKSFYQKPSGGLQIGDYVFCLSFVCFFCETEGRRKISVAIQKDKLLFVYVCAVTVINSIYFVAYLDGDFLKPVLYFIFNFLVVVEFRFLATDDKFLNGFFVSTFFCVFIQVVIYVSGRGRWFDDLRYMGTFNDPNQLAFFIMSRFFIMYIIYLRTYHKNKINFLLMALTFVMSIFLIVRSASTGMFLGLGVFVVVWFVNYCIANRRNSKSVIMVIFLICVCIFLMFGEDKLFFKTSSLSDRVREKLNKMLDGGGSGFIKDRNLGAFFYKPYYILFGAGEGGFFRFLDVADNNELHSTVLSLLFYYGIIPYCILLVWTFKNLKGITILEFSIYVAIFIEMMTLVNHRQSSLWILFILPSVMTKERKLNNDKGEGALLNEQNNQR